jgi:hypothetical protein
MWCAVCSVQASGSLPPSLTHCNNLRRLQPFGAKLEERSSCEQQRGNYL